MHVHLIIFLFKFKSSFRINYKKLNVPCCAETNTIYITLIHNHQQKQSRNKIIPTFHLQKSLQKQSKVTKLSQKAIPSTKFFTKLKNSHYKFDCKSTIQIILQALDEIELEHIRLRRQHENELKQLEKILVKKLN